MKYKLSHFIPNLKDSWFIVLIIIIVGGILSGIITFPLLLLFPECEWIAKLLAYILTFLPAVFLITKRAKSSTNKIDFKSVSLNLSGKILLSIVLLLSTLALSIIIEPLMSLFPTPEWFDNIMKNALDGNIIVTILTVAVAAPLLEEFVVRGTILRGLLHHTTPLKAILWSALIFAVLHLNPWQGLYCMILGSYLGWIYYKTRSLWPVIFMHAINNIVPIILYNTLPDASMDVTTKELLGDANAYYMAYAIAVGIFALSILFITKYIKDNEGHNYADRGEIG